MRVVILAACLLCAGGEASPLPKPVLEQTVETTTTSTSQSSNSTSRRTQSRRLGDDDLEQLISDTVTTVFGTEESDFSRTSVSGPDGSASEATFSGARAKTVEETDINGTDYRVSLDERRARRRTSSDSAGVRNATFEAEFGTVDSRKSIDSDGNENDAITNVTVVSRNVTKCDTCLDDPDVNSSVSTIRLSKDDIDDPGLYEEVEVREPSVASATDQPFSSANGSEPEPAASAVAVQGVSSAAAPDQSPDAAPTSEPPPPTEAEPDDDFHLSFEIKQCRDACCSVFDLRKDCICYQIKIGAGCIIHTVPSANV